MILDTSAIVAILLQEPQQESLLDKLEPASLRIVSAPIMVEAAVVLTHHLKEDTERTLSRFLRTFSVEVVPFVDVHWIEAAKAVLRFGKGHHPAGLNLGDCMTYATAKVAGFPLLCLGNDFSKTDLELA